MICNSKVYSTVLAAGFIAGLFAAPAFSQEVTTDIGTLDIETAAKGFPAKPPYSPYAGRNFPSRPYFGDTHTHTSFSMDAGAFGARLGPKDAYRFAKGEEVIASSGQRAKLSRPLDFLVVSDHSDGMGFFPQLMSGDASLLATPQGRRWGTTKSVLVRAHRRLSTSSQASAAGRCRKGFRHRGHLLIGVRGARRSRRRKRRMILVTLRPSSGSNGHRMPAATTCIEMSSGVRRRQGDPRRAVHDLATARQPQPTRPLEVDGDGRRQDRRRNPRACA